MGWLTDLTNLTGQYAPNYGKTPTDQSSASFLQGIPGVGEMMNAPGGSYATDGIMHGPLRGGGLVLGTPGIDPATGQAFPTGGGASNTPASTAATGSQIPLYGGGGLGASAPAASSGGGKSAPSGGGDDMETAVSNINKNLASAQLASQYNASAAKAQAASQAQYQKLLNSVAATQAAVNANLTQMGKTGEANIARQQAIDTGKTEQDAVARGLGNTTIRNQLLNGVTRNANDARTQLAEQLAQQRIAAQMQMGQMNGDAILSMQNQGPSNDYLNLLMQLASNGSGK